MSCFTKNLTATNLLRIPGYLILTCLLVLNVKPQTWEVLQIKSTICTFLQKSFLPLINTICFNASVFKTEGKEVITLNYRSHINILKNLHSWTSLCTYNIYGKNTFENEEFCQQWMQIRTNDLVSQLTQRHGLCLKNNMNHLFEGNLKFYAEDMLYELSPF